MEIFKPNVFGNFKSTDYLISGPWKLFERIMKKYSIFIVIGLAVLIIGFIFYLSSFLNKESNGFFREARYTSLQLIDSLKINDETQFRRIAGVGRGNIFIGTSKIGEIISIQNFRRVINRYSYEIDSLIRSNADDLIVSIVDSPNVYFLNYNNTVIIRAVLNHKFYFVLNKSKIRFTKAILVDSLTLILRKFSASREGQAFSSFYSGIDSLGEEHFFHEVVQDGGFKTDGTLAFDKETMFCAYAYYYKNSIIIFDTSLKIFKTIKTIDTFATYQVETKRIKSFAADSQSYIVTNSTPAYKINRLCSLSDSLIYVLSMARADNEDRDFFENNNVIDVYSIVTGKYRGSVYLPFFEGGELIDFEVKKNILFALYPKGYKSYRFNILSK